MASCAGSLHDIYSEQDVPPLQKMQRLSDPWKESLYKAEYQSYPDSLYYRHDPQANTGQAATTQFCTDVSKGNLTNL